MEAMAYGVPVVSTSTGGIPELLRDRAGLLVPPKDPTALADAIERLLGDDGLQGQIRTVGRRRIEEEFAVNGVVVSLMKEIEADSRN